VGREPLQSTAPSIDSQLRTEADNKHPQKCEQEKGKEKQNGLQYDISEEPVHGISKYG
jgi:hypothetical protein